MQARFKAPIYFSLLCSLAWLPMGCALEQQSNAQPSGRGDMTEQPPLVDVAIANVAIANVATATGALNYTGTTAPLKTVVVRSRSEGQLLRLTVDVGDRVGQGQLLGEIEPDLLLTEVNEAAAELAARQFEVKEAESELAEVKAQVAQYQAELQQATADAKRLQSLADSGAIAIQTAEVAQTKQATSAQILKSAQEQIITRQQAIAATQKRVTAQQAILNQTQARLSYSNIFAPQTGVVLSKASEAGDTIDAGDDLLEIGDLSAIKVEIQISDRNLTQFALGQKVTVQLDAFPGETFAGEVTRISPVADAAARLIPIEVTLPNPDGKIASGLLARISRNDTAQQTVMIPASALEVGKVPGKSMIFVPVNDGEQTTVQVRPVQVGAVDNGMVEILSGLNAGEKFILKGDRPLETGETVRLSLISE